eukprot:8840867-Pyramimonas_sp.AAC.1
MDFNPAEDRLVLVGSAPQLGAWDLSKALPLTQEGKAPKTKAKTKAQTLKHVKNQSTGEAARTKPSPKTRRGRIQSGVQQGATAETGTAADGEEIEAEVRTLKADNGTRQMREEWVWKTGKVWVPMQPERSRQS